MVKENYTDVLHGKVNVQVGKNGFNEGLIKQIIGEFKNKKFIKVRFLDVDSFGDMDNGASQLAKMTNSTVKDIRGNTCILKKNRS